MATGDARDMTPSRAAARPAPRASPPPRAEMGHSRGGCGPAATIPACRAVSGGSGGGTRVSPPGHPRVDDVGGGGRLGHTYICTTRRWIIELLKAFLVNWKKMFRGLGNETLE